MYRKYYGIPQKGSFFNKNCNLIAFNFTENKLLRNIFSGTLVRFKIFRQKILEKRVLAHGLPKFLTPEFFELNVSHISVFLLLRRTQRGQLHVFFLQEK